MKSHRRKTAIRVRRNLPHPLHLDHNFLPLYLQIPCFIRLELHLAPTLSTLPLPYSPLSLVFLDNSRALPSLSYLHHSWPCGQMLSFSDFRIPPGGGEEGRLGGGSMGMGHWNRPKCEKQLEQGKHNFKVKYETWKRMLILNVEFEDAWGSAKTLKGHCHEDFAVLGQLCAKIITLRF